MTTPLEYVTTEELIAELRKRFDGGILGMFHKDMRGDSKDNFVFEYWGGQVLAIGATSAMHQTLLADHIASRTRKEED